MVSSAPASSSPRLAHSLERASNPVPATYSAAVPAPPRGAGNGAEHVGPWVRFLTLPAAFFASNWAAMLLIPTIVGTLPALVATTRTTTNLSEYSDRAFRETLRTGVRLLRRDGPASLALWAIIALVFADVMILTRLVEGGTRVLLVGIALPPMWAAVSLLSAYVVASASLPIAALRREVARAGLSLAVGRPVRAVLAPALIIALAPLWLLAPLTIAIGFSFPPHLLAHLWTSRFIAKPSTRPEW